MGQSTVHGSRENSLSDRLHCPKIVFQPCQSGPEMSCVDEYNIRNLNVSRFKTNALLTIKWVNLLYLVEGRILYLIGYIAPNLLFSPASQVLKRAASMPPR